MKLFTRILLGTCAVAALGWTPSVLADAAGEKLDGIVAQLQQQIRLRHQLAEDLVQSQLALGYSVPEVLDKQGQNLFAKADDDAFTRAMNNLHMTLSMYAKLD
ncbi:MAG: hypothetical protein ABI606_08195 [Rhodoferax sp.]